MSFKWNDEIEKPMNPYATEDFKNAIASATERINKGMEDMRKQFEGISFMNLEDMEDPYCGKCRLKWDGRHKDFVNILLVNGYEVILKMDDEKYVTVEFEEV